MRTNLPFADALTETLRHAEQLRRRGAAITVAALREEADRDEARVSPDPYERDLKILRERYRTPRSIADAEYKIERFTALAAEYAEMAKHAPPRLRTMTAAEIEQFTPPDPYALALAARNDDPSRTKRGSR